MTKVLIAALFCAEIVFNVALGLSIGALLRGETQWLPAFIQSAVLSIGLGAYLVFRLRKT